MSHALAAWVAELERDRGLREPERLRQRSDVLERLETWRIGGLPPGESAALGQRIEAVCAELEAIDAGLCRRIRRDIRRGAGVRRWLERARATDTEREVRSPVRGDSYDYLDALVSDVLQLDEPHALLTGLAAEMVFYQPTPARHILEMLERSALDERDVLIDLGSGLGQVPLLASLCTGARCIGIEWEAAYVDCARRCARALKLERVTFVQGDARAADLAAGTLFYLYTPFTGAMLREMLDRLRAEAAGREIRLCTLGPCSATVAQEPWLQAIGAWQPDRPALFRSVLPGLAAASGAA